MNKNIHKEDDITLEEEIEEKSGFVGKSDKKLRQELKQAQKEAKEYLDGWQRARADLINFKRESEKRRQQLARFAVEDFLYQLLPVLDSFDAAIEHGDDGTKHIYKQLLSILKTNNIEQISPMGDKFNPNIHESVATIQVENKKDDQTIVEVVQKGYTLHEKLIRPAKVRVGEFKR